MKNKGIFCYSILTLLLFASISFAEAQNNQKYIKNNRGFIENKGQIHDQNFAPNSNIKYILNSNNGLNVQLRATGFSYDSYNVKRKAIQQKTPNRTFVSPLEELTYYFHRIDIELVGANKNAKIITNQVQDEVINYNNSITPNEGINGLNSYNKITYLDIYPGIDLEFLAHQGIDKPIEYNFIIHKNGDIRQIQLKYLGANSAKIIDSKIELGTSNGKMTEKIPSSWIMETNQKQNVVYNIISENNHELTVGFKLASKRTDGTLIIDPTPTIEWATYAGDSGNDMSYGVSTDLLNNVYVTGRTQGGGSLATTGAHQVVFAGNYDAFLTKYNSAGVRQWSTYYGGTDLEFGCKVAVDLAGGVSIVGKTRSTTGIASVGAQQTTFSGSDAIFLARFNTTTGVRQWGRYYGGGSDGSVNTDLPSIVASPTLPSRIFITGITNSTTNISTAGAFQTAYTDYGDAFVAKFNTTGTIVWGTYYGTNNGVDGGYDITLDANKNVIVSGITNSTSGLATTGAHQTTFGGDFDAFLLKLDSNGAQKWCTYYGGANYDFGSGVAADASGNIFMTGVAGSSTAISTAGSYQSTFAGGGFDGMLAKFNSNGVRQWGTYYGGSNEDVGRAITLTCGNDVIIAGETQSLTTLSTINAYDSTWNGDRDIMFAKFNSSGVRQWGSYYGGSGREIPYDITISPLNKVLFCGETASTNTISTINGLDTIYGGNTDGFIAQFNEVDIIGTTTVCENSTLSLTGQISSTATPINYAWTGPSGNTATGATLSIPNIALTSSGLYSLTITANGCTYFTSDSVKVIPSPTVVFTGDTIVCAGDSINLAVTGGTSYIWSGPNSFSSSFSSISIANASLSADGVYSVTVSNSNGCYTILNKTIVVHPTPIPTINSNSPICAYDTVRLQSGGGSDYIWSGPNSYVSTFQNPIISTFDSTASGSYSVIVSNSFGCTASASTIVVVKSNPKPILSSNSPICSGDSLKIYSTSGNSYNWIGPNGFTNTNQNIIIFPSNTAMSGRYRMTVSYANGCSNMDSIDVLIHPNPILTISSNSPICAYDTIRLQSGGGTGYLWSGPNSYVSTFQNPIFSTFDTTASGSYSVIVTNSFGCTATGSTMVVVKSNPKPILSSNSPICSGDSLKIYSTSGNSYNWSGPNGLTNSNQNALIFPSNTTMSGQYTMLITYINGCSNKDSIDILIRANPVLTISNDTTICLHQGVTIIVSGASTYLWNNGENSDSYLIYPTMDTVYRVIGTDVFGCKSTDSISLHIFPFVEISLTQDPAGLLLKDQLVTFSAMPTGYNNYTFLINNNIVQNSSSNTYTTSSLITSDTVSVITSTSNICFSTPKLGVRVIDIYNSFSPNNDGENDVFMQGYQITVFNRWGQVVYEGMNGWDGKYQGAEVNTGSYYFTLKYNSSNSAEIEYKGTLMLVR